MKTREEERGQLIREAGEFAKGLKSNGLQFVMCILEETDNGHYTHTNINVNDEHHALDIMSAVMSSFSKGFHK